MNVEEVCILFDFIGCFWIDVVWFLLDVGIDIVSRGLDEGIGFYMVVWFG